MQQPSFDTWTSLFLLAVGMGIFLFISLITSRQRKNRPIAFLVLAFSVILFQYVLYWTAYEKRFPYLMMLPHVCYYCAGPLLLLYLNYLYKEKQSRLFFLHFIPALVVFITYGYILINQLGIARIKPPFLSFSQNPWFVVAHLFTYCLLAFRLVFTGKRSTQTEKLRHRWSVLLVSLFALFSLAYLAYYTLVQFPFFNDTWDYAISITMCIGIYTIGFFMIKQPQVFNGDFFAAIFLPSEKKEVAAENDFFEKLYTKLIHFMNTEKPYTNNELRMVQLADQIGLSAHNLSKIINVKYGKNFNQFINEYRLEAAAEMLLEFPKEPIQNIYYQVGFNNKASFYNSFKSKYHCTPAQYRARTLNPLN